MSQAVEAFPCTVICLPGIASVASQSAPEDNNSEITVAGAADTDNKDDDEDSDEVGEWCEVSESMLLLHQHQWQWRFWIRELSAGDGHKQASGCQHTLPT